MRTRSPGGRSVDLHVAWTKFQRRQVSMASICGFECIFLERSRQTGLVATVRDYLRLARQTLRLLRERQPRVLWVQMPTTALLWVALAARTFWLRELKLVADCHNAMFRPPWSRVPFGVSWLRYCDAVVVHNDEVLSDAVALGVPELKMRVLEDVPPQDHGCHAAARVDGPGTLPVPVDLPRPWVLLPGSFSHDEPIFELLEAARTMPEVTFIITGRTDRAARQGHDLSALPRNVVTPGFLDRDTFDRLLRAADLVLGLTRYEGVQLSVCNEALGFNKAMVVSDTRVLRELFGDACELAADHHPETLRHCIQSALDRRDELAQRARVLAAARVDNWRRVHYPHVEELLRGPDDGERQS